ncbi:MAG TPA: nitroreductase family protein [Ktedonobacterales bacterium]|nr:nitroreductase family protein [Ktedonobacterales bacterium]
MNVSDAVRAMRAVRRFTDRPVPEEAIRAILNAGRRAQSSKNTQPWQFVAIRDRNTLKQLSECGAYAGHLAGAAFAVALISPNPTGFDLGQATAFMQLQAWELGIGSCIASMYEPERAKAILGVPDDLHFNVALSFGYPVSTDQWRPAAVTPGRKPFDEVVHWEKW